MMELTLPEKFLLIAQHPEKGRLFISGVPLQFGLIGSFLLELSDKGCLEIKDGMLLSRNKGAELDPLSAGIEQMIRNSPRSRKVKTWIRRLGNRSAKLKWELFRQLEKSRLIRIEKRKFLGLIPYRVTLLTGRRQRSELIRQIKLVVQKKEAPEGDMMFLLGIVNACKMHRALSEDRHARRKLKSDMKEVLEANPLTEAVDKTIKEVQAAVMVSVMAATTAATSAGHR